MANKVYHIRIPTTYLAALVRHMVDTEEFPRKVTKSGAITHAIYMYMAEHGILPYDNVSDAEKYIESVCGTISIQDKMDDIVMAAAQAAVNDLKSGNNVEGGD